MRVGGNRRLGKQQEQSRLERENLARNGILSPNSTARSESIYRLESDKNAYKILVGKFKIREGVEDLGVVGKIAFEKCSARKWTGINWLRIKKIVDLL
jgi:hypothetical protein